MRSFGFCELSTGPTKTRGILTAKFAEKNPLKGLNWR